MRFSPGVTRLMLGVVGIGIKKSCGVRQVQHPLAQVVRISRVIARQRHQCASPFKSVHGKSIALSVRGAPDQAMRVQTVPAIRYHSPPRSSLKLAARLEASIHQLGDVVMKTPFGVHACGDQRAIGQQHFIEWTLLDRLHLQRMNGPVRGGQEAWILES